MTWDFALPDWWERLQQGRPLVPETLPLDQEAARRAVDAFRLLRLADVEGTPTLGDAGGEWFERIVAALFGSWDPVARERWIREVFLLVPKKNSKTTNGALLMLVALLLNRRPHAPFCLTAPMQDTADEAFEAIVGAIDLDPVLRKKIHVRDHLKTLVHRETGATLEIITFDYKALTGRKFVGTLLDELHVIGRMANASKAIRQIRGGMVPFPEAFLVTITTQSDGQPAGSFRSELLKAREVRDGKRKGGRTLPVLYEFPPEIQRARKPEERGREGWRDSKLWAFVNPNVGRSITVPRLLDGFGDQRDEEELQGWASQHLNVEVGTGINVDGWVGATFWDLASESERVESLDKLLEASEVVTIGLDGGGLDDLLGVSVLGRRASDKRWLHWGLGICHAVALERRKEEADRLRSFEEDGDLVIVDEVGDDAELVADICEKVEKSGLLDNVGMDPAGVGALADAIEARKIARERIIGIPQGWRLAGAVKSTERKLAGGDLIHQGSAFMQWTVGNAKIEQRANAILVSKAVSGVGKIDPVIALFNSAALMTLNPKPRSRKYQFFVL